MVVPPSMPKVRVPTSAAERVPLRLASAAWSFSAMEADGGCIRPGDGDGEGLSDGSAIAVRDGEGEGVGAGFRSRASMAGSFWRRNKRRRRNRE